MLKELSTFPHLRHLTAFSRTPGFGSAMTSEKVSLLSPAGRRLVTNKLGIRLSTGKAFTTPDTPSTRAMYVVRSYRYFSYFRTRTPGTSGFASSKTPISSMIKKPIRTPSTPGTPSLSSLTDDLMPVCYFLLHIRTTFRHQRKIHRLERSPAELMLETFSNSFYGVFDYF